MSQDLGKLLEQERQTVLSGLQKLKSERERWMARREKLMDQEYDLLYRGQQAGLPVQEMAEACDMSRQSLHKRLRVAKEIVEWEQKQKKREAEDA